MSAREVLSNEVAKNKNIYSGSWLQSYVDLSKEKLQDEMDMNSHTF